MSEVGHILRDTHLNKGPMRCRHMFVGSLTFSWHLICELGNMDTQDLCSHIQWRHEEHYSPRKE